MAALHRFEAGIDLGASSREWRALLGPEGAVSLRESRWVAVASVDMDELLSRYQAAGLSLAHAPDGPPDHLGVQVLFTAHVIARLSAEELGTTGETSPEDLAWIRDRHLGTFAPLVLAEVKQRASTVLLAALPELVSGYLDAVDDVLAGRVPAGSP